MKGKPGDMWKRDECWWKGRERNSEMNNEHKREMEAD